MKDINEADSITESNELKESEELIEQISNDASNVIKEVIDKAKLKAGQLFVIGCSSSETIGEHMGTASSKDAAEAIFEAIIPELENAGVSLAVQCCEHLNRSLVVEREVAEKYGFEEVNVIPQPHAGGAFAVKAYGSLKDPVVVENIDARADAGIDIGGVMVGMHIHPVVVPLRLEHRSIGKAIVVAARRRPKYVGGIRAVYNDDLE
ncbi:TIGR01440 family protein [Lachnospiraceae bacterium NE2001]|nr:TIGR01440 family protein [Lachnospiraceae bacterium NE2001]